VPNQGALTGASITEIVQSKNEKNYTFYVFVGFGFYNPK